MHDRVSGVLTSSEVECYGRGHAVDSHPHHPASESVRGVLICSVKPAELRGFFVVRPQNTQVWDALPAARALGHSIESSTDSDVFEWVVDQKIVASSSWLLVHGCVLCPVADLEVDVFRQSAKTVGIQSASTR